MGREGGRGEGKEGRKEEELLANVCYPVFHTHVLSDITKCT